MEIGNFVQNAGMFGDLEISISTMACYMFDTMDIYINNVFPNTEYPEIILWNLSILLRCNFKVILMMEI